MAEEQKGSSGNQWSFFRAGGVDQVRMDRLSDLQALDQLDQKLWVALSCPTGGLECDAAMLAHIDVDKDGKIRAPELLAAVKWACSLLKDPTLLFTPSVLSLDEIDGSAPEGAQLIASARRILADLGKPDATSISVEDTNDTSRVFLQSKFNGDGILPADSAEEPASFVIADILKCKAPLTDRNGKPGVDQATVDQFFDECKVFMDWLRQSQDQPELSPLGADTADGYPIMEAVRLKIDDYFARTRLASFDPRAIAALNREEKEYLELAAKDLTIDSAEISALPLSRIEAGRNLPLLTGVNPAWAGALANFHSRVFTPLHGASEEMTEGQWHSLQEKFKLYKTWLASKPAVSVEVLGPDRIREILDGNSRGRITDLIAKDKALEPEFEAILSVDKLVRFRKGLITLLNNFISFRDFYSQKEKAIFQAGTLYLDQRSCDLCIRVEDMAKHLTMSHLSRCYLLYCDCARRGTNEKMTIVALVTGGDSENLIAGRNGIFYDRKGRDWDATVVKIVDNPISIREAFWGPYKKLIRWIGEQIAKRAAMADSAASSKLQAASTTAAKSATQAPAPDAPAPAKKKLDIGVVAALGVAVGGITAAFGAIMHSFFGLGIWMPLGLVGLILMISGPSMLIAWLKLRHRNLGPLLDANGWAVNAKVKITIPFGRAMTGMPKLPKGSKHDMTDPFEKKPSKYRWVVLLAILLALLGILWLLGGMDFFNILQEALFYFSSI